MPSNQPRTPRPQRERGRAIRRRMAETGETWGEAKRQVDLEHSSGAQPVGDGRVFARIALDAELGWLVHVDDLRQPAPIRVRFWEPGTRRDDLDAIVARLDNDLDAAGWQLAPGTVWPDGDPRYRADGFLLVRSGRGVRVDEWARIVADGGLAPAEPALGYVLAVMGAIERHGVEAANFDIAHQGTRAAGILISGSHRARGDIELWIDWDETTGWSYMPRGNTERTQPGDRVGDLLGRLPVLPTMARMPVPDQVGGAAARLLGVSTKPRPGPVWEPPADYDDDPIPADEHGPNPAQAQSLAAYAKFDRAFRADMFTAILSSDTVIASALAPHVQTAEGGVLPGHDHLDPDKLDQLIDGMEYDGWQGQPVVVHGQWAVTGTHRLVAVARLALEFDVHLEVPRIQARALVERFSLACGWDWATFERTYAHRWLTGFDEDGSTLQDWRVAARHLRAVLPAEVADYLGLERSES